ncbi:hypothetical protein ACIRPU_12605 [Streptomyces sp. NPDC102259]|uniref:hypothetical protein n=1 Tax=Streptomyces sp. NPDC102259 TaxID=3366148 RepID=UPI0038023258
MIIIYAPADGAEQHFDAGPGKLRASEIQIIERTADGRWNEIKSAMGQGDINAMRTVAYVLKKRAEPSLRLAQFDPFEGELRVRLDRPETEAFAEQLFEKYQGTPDLEDAFEELRDATFDREYAETAIAAVTAPKVQAPAEPAPEPETGPMEESAPSLTGS